MESTKSSPAKEVPINEMQELSIEEISKNLKNILEVNVAIWRRNRDNQLVVIPVKKLEQYLGEKDADTYKFYIEINWRERIKEHESAIKKTGQTQAPQTTDEALLMKQVEKFGRVEEQAVLFRAMSVVEREEILDECISKLSEEDKEKAPNIELVVRMVEVITNTFHANNANLEENITTDNVKENINGVLVKSNWIVKILISIFNRRDYPYEGLNFIEKISTGSKTVDHINKVFLRFVSFCVFYNEFIDKGLFTKSIRGAYKERYHRHYKKKFPDMEVTIERIFKNGIRRVESEKEFQSYALGALLYDIGKVSNISYHDGTAPYDEDTMKKHALHGYNMLIKAKQYPFEALAMSVFHHEYYGGKGSYNFTKPLVSKFSGKKTEEESIKYFICYDKDDFLNGISLAYFPCKIIEIIDVFNALVSKKNYPVIEALTIMKKEFIAKTLKIDPILFRIFMEYIARCGVLKNDEMENIDLIII